MQLLTKKLKSQLPKLNETESTPTEDKKVIVKFFTPDSSWTWYAVEFDGDDQFFGLVDGFEKEWGYFSLAELQSVRGPMGLPIERDRYFGLTLVADGELSDFPQILKPNYDSQLTICGYGPPYMGERKEMMALKTHIEA